MEWYERTGECEQCGECCANSPWPKEWPGNLLDKTPEEIWTIFPHGLLFFGLANESGKTVWSKNHGIAMVDNKEYPWLWHKDNGFVKGSQNFECPFLGSAGDKRPCMLVGTEFQHAFDVACKEAITGIPQFMAHTTQVQRWEENHPNCSFKYMKVDKYRSIGVDR